MVSGGMGEGVAEYGGATGVGRDGIDGDICAREGRFFKAGTVGTAVLGVGAEQRVRLERAHAGGGRLAAVLFTRGGSEGVGAAAESLPGCLSTRCLIAAVERYRSRKPN